MKKKAGRPSKGASAGTVKPNIGGMKTLGPTPISAGIYRGKSKKAKG